MTVLRTHLTLEEDVKDFLTNRAHEKEVYTVLRAVCDGDPTSLKEVGERGSMNSEKGQAALNKIIAERRETPLGAFQVESLLRFTVEQEIEDAIEDARGDDIVYGQLKVHRILGSSKSPAFKKEPYKISKWNEK